MSPGTRICDTSEDDTNPSTIPTWAYNGICEPLNPLPNLWCKHSYYEPIGCVMWFIWVWSLGCKERPHHINVGQLKLSNISFDGWIIYPYVYGLPDVSSKFVWLPAHKEIIVQTETVTCDVAVVIPMG